MQSDLNERPSLAGSTARRRVIWRRRLLVASALAGCTFATAAVLVDRQGWPAVVAWLLSVGLAVAVFADEWGPALRGWHLSRRTVAVLGLCLVPVAVRLTCADTRRVHGDELITAYFSLTEDLGPGRFFAEVPKDSGEWVSQFSTPFFLLQKAALRVVGDDIAGIRLSVQPYVFLVALFLFLIARRIVDTRTAVFAVVLYSFLAISLYHETLGLHFVSSTAVFLVFFWFAFRASQHGLASDAVVAGALCGFCYLFYVSSYIALPVLAVFVVTRVLRTRRVEPVRNVVLPGFGFLVVMAPFLAYAVGFNNYFLARIQQVSLLTGSWSDVPERMKAGESAFYIVAKSLILALKALYRRGVGGHGGYFFGQLALFDTLTLALFVLGLGLAFSRLLRRPGIGMILMVLGVSFFTGVVLTIPPPAFHRLSLTFPFIALILAFPLRALWDAKVLSRPIRAAVLIGLVVVFAARNLDYFSVAAVSDGYPEDLRVASYINRRFPDRQVYVAAFPGQAFQKLAYFADVRRSAKIITNYHNDLLQSFRTDEKYVYVIAMPDNFGEKFHALDPKSRFVRFTIDYGLLFN